MTYFRLKLNLQEGHLDLVKYLLENGALVNAQTGTGDTALTYACENGHTDVSDLLLQYNAELVRNYTIVISVLCQLLKPLSNLLRMFKISLIQLFFAVTLKIGGCIF